MNPYESPVIPIEDNDYKFPHVMFPHVMFLPPLAGTVLGCLLCFVSMGIELWTGMTPTLAGMYYGGIAIEVVCVSVMGGELWATTQRKQNDQ